MPIFEYRCGQCGHVTEFLEKAGAKGEHACEQCGSTATEKVFSTFAAQSGQAAAPSCPRRGTCPSGTCPLAK
jgi:putative FmdB family regulatory protein